MKIKLKGCVFMANEDDTRGLLVTTDSDAHDCCRAQPLAFSPDGRVQVRGNEIEIWLGDLRISYFYLAQRSTLEKTRQFC
jgi:hypothetical protein